MQSRTTQVMQNEAIRRNTPMPVCKAETHTNKVKKGDQTYFDQWDNSKLMQKLAEGHTAATDTSAQINEIHNEAIMYGRTAAFGRSLAKVVTTDQEILKVRLPQEGKAVKTSANTIELVSKGQRNEFVELRVNKEIVAKESWTQSYIEDSNWDVMQEQVNEMAYNLAKLESEIIINGLKDIASGSSHAGKITKGSDPGEVAAPTADLLIQLRGKLSSKNRQITHFVMSEDVYTSLLQDDAMQDTNFFGSIINYETGTMGQGQFLGAYLMPTTLMPADTIYAIDSMAALIYALRRDNLIMPFDKPDEQKVGVRISTRYELKTGRADALAWWGD